MNQRQFERRPSKPTANPRKVVGGVKLSSRKVTSAQVAEGVHVDMPWVIQRWMRLVETYAPGDQLAEGLDYARLGQARSLDLGPGTISARVQGRMPKAYCVSVRLPVFTESQWPPVIEAMIAQARYAAALLSGEVPANIEDLFIPAGLKLFPSEPSDVAVSCDCAIFTGKSEVDDGTPAPTLHDATDPDGTIAPVSLPRGTPASTASSPSSPPIRQPARPIIPRVNIPLPPGVPWCKHACCTMALVADRLAADPFLIFALRGLRGDDLIDRLRQRRIATGGARPGGTMGNASLVYESHLPGISDRPSKPLAQCIDSFWTSAGSIDDLDLPIGPPEVSHPLLRRMGPSPFPKAKFPIVGLLATCYDLVSQHAIEDQTPMPAADEDTIDHSADD